MRAHNFKDRVGHRYGRLVVLRIAPDIVPPAWICQCDCGDETTVPSRSLTTYERDGLGCGCRWKVRHGMSHSRTFVSWRSMHLRCSDARSGSYERYGAVGIAVCSRWNDFDTFLADMGQAPSEKHTIDRIDSTKGYALENCRWLSVAEQTSSRKSAIWVPHDGTRKTLKQCADATGIPYKTLYRRYARGARGDALFREVKQNAPTPAEAEPKAS